MWHFNLYIEEKRMTGRAWCLSVHEKAEDTIMRIWILASFVVMKSVQGMSLLKIVKCALVSSLPMPIVWKNGTPNRGDVYCVKNGANPLAES
jgi:hypothetical protein